jgi:thiamine biosynthesis lipoprotein
MLGTLVEVGISSHGEADHAAVESAFEAMLAAQRALSRFDPASDVGRFHALARGQSQRVSTVTRDVLLAARELWLASDGAFDVSLGTGPEGWRCEGVELHKLSDEVRLDLGGIGKGHAVDMAVQALRARGCAAGWVNAGGDLRAFGEVEVPVHVRDEAAGGVRPFATVQDCALATSHFDTGTRSRLVACNGARAVRAHVSVCAPLCLQADALTKVVAISGEFRSALLTRYQAKAWKH